MLDFDNLCSRCGIEHRMNGRTICSKCNNIRAKEWYHKGDNKNRKLRYGVMNCEICGKNIIRVKREQKFCKDCFTKINKTKTDDINISSKYIKSNKKTSNLHRDMFEQTVMLADNDVVHHIDENYLNNDPSNLIIMSNRDHPKLHYYLRLSKMLLSETINQNNNWNELRYLLTLDWFHKNNKQFITLETYNYIVKIDNWISIFSQFDGEFYW